MLDEVGLPEPGKLVRAFPHQLSGGQRQRVMIAMAVALEPRILIADEPTTALDVTTQGQILKLIARLQCERDMSVLLITHDFGVVADIADRVAVMREGRIVEIGTAEEVLRQPQHGYTKTLLAAVPSLTPPERLEKPQQAVVLAVDKLCKTYVSRVGLFKPPRVELRLQISASRYAEARRSAWSVNFGSGKSTVGRCVVRLLDPNSGAIRLGDVDFLAERGENLRRMRRRIQMIFQDPYASLNPRKSVAGLSATSDRPGGPPKDKGHGRTSAGRQDETRGAGPECLSRYPHEFSGGQRQRIGIARALAWSRISSATKPFPP